MLDGTVVNVALERIGADLGASFGGLQWTVNAYTLTLASLILLGGSLGDRFGRRRVFVIGVVWFAVASLLCGLAPNLELLIAGRALQGVGGALLTPGSLALISASFRGPDRAAAIGAWSGLGGDRRRGRAVPRRLAGGVDLAGGVPDQPAARGAGGRRRAPARAREPRPRGRARPGRSRARRWPRVGAGGADLVADRPRRGRCGRGAAGRAGGGAGRARRVRRRRAPVAAPAGAAAAVRRPRVHRGERRRRCWSTGRSAWCSCCWCCSCRWWRGSARPAAGAALLPVTAIMLVFSARAGALAERIGPRLPMTRRPADERGRPAPAAPHRPGRELGGGRAARRPRLRGRAGADRRTADRDRARLGARPVRRRRVAG